MLETMKITIVDDCVVEANPKNEKKKQQQELPSYIKDNRKTKYLTDIGMDLTKYHPTVINHVVGGGRKEIPENLKPQLIEFAVDAKTKNFQPRMFGHGTQLDRLIKQTYNIKPRQHKKKEPTQNTILDMIENHLQMGHTDVACDIMEQYRNILGDVVYNGLRTKLRV